MGDAICFHVNSSVSHSEVVTDKCSLEEESIRDIVLNKFKEDLNTDPL